MKYLIFALLIVVVGCDTPTRSRFPSTGSTGDALGTGFTTLPPTPVTPTTPTTPTSPATPGFENCNLTKSSSTADLGGIGICKNTVTETKIRIVSSLTNTTSRTCIIPTYKDQAGNSTYLGDPQCLYTKAEEVVEGGLVKNRNGLSGYPINGVMIMREQLLVEYFGCMDAYAKYISYYCPANPTYAPCAQGASNYRAQICNQFKSKYPNNYIDRFL